MKMLHRRLPAVATLLAVGVGGKEATCFDKGEVKDQTFPFLAVVKPARRTDLSGA